MPSATRHQEPPKQAHEVECHQRQNSSRSVPDRTATPSVAIWIHTGRVDDHCRNHGDFGGHRSAFLSINDTKSTSNRRSSLIATNSDGAREIASQLHNIRSDPDRDPGVWCLRFPECHLSGSVLRIGHHAGLSNRHWFHRNGDSNYRQVSSQRHRVYDHNLKCQRFDADKNADRMLEQVMPNLWCLRRSRGLTMIEMLVTVTIVAILLAIALPSFTNFVARGRVAGAAEATAQDFHLIKTEAIRNNNDVTISFNEGSSWCYGAIKSSSPCVCTTTNSCSLRAASSIEFPSVSMAVVSGSNQSTFSALRGMGSPIEIEYSSSDAGKLRVSMNAAGRVSICRVSGSFSSYPAC